MDFNSLTPEQKEMVSKMTPKDLAMVQTLNASPEELAASGGSDYPETDNYQLKYFNGDNYANFGVLSQDIVAIDTQMKKNEKAASDMTEEVSEISQSVQTLETEMPTVKQNAQTALDTANTANTTATAASTAANNASTEVGQVSRQVTTLSADVGQVETTQETMQQDIQTNTNNITGLSTTVGNLNTTVTGVSSKLNTTISNVQKLSAGFNNHLTSDNSTGKTVNVIISKTSVNYIIRISTSFNNDVPFIFDINASSYSPPMIKKSGAIPLTSNSTRPDDGAVVNAGIGSLYIQNVGAVGVILSGLAFNNTIFIVSIAQFNEFVSDSVDLSNFTFDTSEITLLKLPPVPIVNPTSTTAADNHNNPNIPYDGTSSGGSGKVKPEIEL